MFNSTANIFLYSLIKKKLSYTLGILSLSLISTACNVVGTILLIPVFSILFDNNQLSEKSGYLIVINSLIYDFDLEIKLLILFGSLVGIILSKNTANYISTILSFKHLKYLIFQMKMSGLEMLCEVDFDYYRKNRTEDILSKLNREIEKAALSVRSLQKILIISIIITILTIILAIISWELTLVSGITLTFIVLMNNWLLTQVRKLRITSVQATQSTNSKIIEFLSGIRLIKTVANEPEEYDKIAESILEKDRGQVATQLIAATIKPMTEIAGVILVLALTVVAYFSDPQTISVIAPTFIIYLIILFRLLPFISQFNSTRLQYINTRSSIEVVAKFLTKENKPISNSGDHNLINLTTEIEFKDVTFAYPNHGQIVLDKISFSIPQGKKTALVGFSGTSNSIIIDLLTRFYDPIEGKILLNGIPLPEYNTPTLRKAIAIVSRETFLFNHSLAYNIAYGIDQVSEADIIDAAKKAQIYQFIQQLPSGLATKVGERGITLSEFQKHKISFARAFLRNPEIVILDQPFDVLNSNLLDLESIKEMIDSLCYHRTTLIITKQLELAKTANQIIFFSNGKIIEVGTHQQLLQQSNLYQRLYSMQFKTNQESRQLKLAQKIARKLTQQNDGILSEEIRLNLNTLLNSLELLSQGTIEDEPQQDIILDESFQSAKNMLASLKEYERKISQEINDYE